MIIFYLICEVNNVQSSDMTIFLNDINIEHCECVKIML